MPGPILTGALAQLGTSLGLQLLGESLSRKPSVQLHRQQHRPTGGPFAPVQAAEGPIPLLWGQHDRYAPKLVYAQRTQYDVTVRGQNDPVGTATQPARGNRLHLVYGISWGACEKVDGIWVNGTFVDISTSQTPGDDGEGPRFDLPSQKGRGRIYLQADGMQGGAIRRNTLPLANSIDPHTGGVVDLNWKDTDTMWGWSYIYLQFDADPKDVTLEPTTPLEGWPEIELSVRGRKVLIPSSDDDSGWSLGYTDSAAAIAHDILRLAGHADSLVALDTWESHRVCTIPVEVSLPGSDIMPFWRSAAIKPNTPTAFDATIQGWQTDVPTDDPPANTVWWWVRRSGSSSDFEYTDVLPWRFNIEPPELVGTDGFSRVTSEYGVDINIEEPDIRIERAADGQYWRPAATMPAKPTTFLPASAWSPNVPTEDAPSGQRYWTTTRSGTSGNFEWTDVEEWEFNQVTIKLPPGTPTTPDPIPPGYVSDYAPQQTGIMYPANVLMGSDELTERGLADALLGLEFTMQGRITTDGGRIRILAGWKRPVIGTVTDGTDCEVTQFRAADSADRQWNVVTMSLPNGGPNGTETQVVEVKDDVLVERMGRRVLAMGQQPYVADVSHGRRLAVTSLVRRRHQRQGTITLPPDSPLLEAATSGARIRVQSDRYQLESYRHNEQRQVVATDYTTFAMLGTARNPDGSISAAIEEDPDENWQFYTALPNLDPDVSEPGVVAPAPQNLSLNELYRLTDGGSLHLEAAWDPSPDNRALLRWRPIIPTGESLDYEVYAGAVIRLTSTPEWGAVGSFVLGIGEGLSRIEFGQGSTFKGFEHEVELAFATARGVISPYSTATITPQGPPVAPVTGLSLTRHGYRFVDGVVIGVRAAYTADDSPDQQVQLRYRVKRVLTGGIAVFSLDGWVELPWGGTLIFPGTRGATYDVQARRGYQDAPLFVSDWSASESILLDGDLTPPDDPTNLVLTGIQGGYEASVDDPRELMDGATPQQTEAAIQADVHKWAWFHTEVPEGDGPTNPPGDSFAGRTNDPHFTYSSFEGSKRVKVWVRAIDVEEDGDNASGWVSGIVETLKPGPATGSEGMRLTLSASPTGEGITGIVSSSWIVPSDVPDFWKVQYGIETTEGNQRYGTADYVPGTESSHSRVSNATLPGRTIVVRLQPASQTAEGEYTTGGALIATAAVEEGQPDASEAPPAPVLSLDGANIEIVFQHVPFATAYVVQRRWADQPIGPGYNWHTLFGSDHDYPARENATGLIVRNWRPAGRWAYRIAYLIGDQQSPYSEHAEIVMPAITGTSSSDQAAETGNDLGVVITGDDVVASGTSLTLTAAVEPAGTTSYTWYAQLVGGSPIGTGGSVTVHPTADTVYRVEATQSGMTASAQHAVRVGSAPTALPTTDVQTSAFQVGAGISWRIELDYDQVANVDSWLVQTAIGTGDFNAGERIVNAYNNQAVAGFIRVPTANEQTIELGAPFLESAGVYLLSRDNNNQIDGRFLDLSGGVTAGYFRFIRARSTSAAANPRQIWITLTSTSSATVRSNNVQFTEAIEDGTSPFTLSRSGDVSTFTTTGPTLFPGNLAVDETNEYHYQPPAASDGDALFDWIAERPSDTYSITIRDTPAATQIRVRLTPRNEFGDGAAQDYTISIGDVAAPSPVEISVTDAQMWYVADEFPEVSFRDFRSVVDIEFTGGDGAVVFYVEYWDPRQQFTGTLIWRSGATYVTGANRRRVFLQDAAFWNGMAPTTLSSSAELLNQANYLPGACFRVRAVNELGETISPTAMSPIRFVDWPP